MVSFTTAYCSQTSGAPAYLGFGSAATSHTRDELVRRSAVNRRRYGASLLEVVAG
ncbi:MAG: hypothetical protein LBR38_05255 [Synergistaceae bacterium]|jgi:hypothetical protein|nr:hypothetical protein [Synergistaceae bacterium]